MRILAIDPGNKQSAWVLYDSDSRQIKDCGIEPNAEGLERLKYYRDAELLAIEMVACYGMPVGKEVFETCIIIGRMLERWLAVTGHEGRRIYRLDVKMALCHDSRAKDTNIRQAIIDRFPATGGGKTPQIGTSKQPGPLFGLKADMWSALAVALTAAEKL